MSVPRITEAEIVETLQSLQDPELGRPLGESKMLKGVSVDEHGSIEVSIELPTPAYPRKERIADQIRSRISEKFPQASVANVEFGWNVLGNESGGRIGLRAKNVIAVGSGKGGVGKSTMAAALSYGLKHYGATVGLMDADVYGPSIPHLLGAKGEPAMVEMEGSNGQVINRIEPVEHDGMKLMSIGFIVPEEQAVIWRGPMLHKLLTQFLQDTEWGELDYLIIDLPPGTGDVSLTISQLLGLSGAVVVCTPQKVALLDAVKSVGMFNQAKIPILGMVENMSGEIFGRGGAKRQAEELGIPFLGEIPIEAEIRIRGDQSQIATVLDESCPARPHLLRVCEAVAMQIARQMMNQPALPTLEII